MALEKDNSWQSEPPINPPTVDEVKIIEPRGPWKTKSGGNLMVLLAMAPPELFNKYLEYDKKELAKLPEDIRSLRFYTVRELPEGEIGGTEFHRVRREIIFELEGETSWELEDLYGETMRITLDQEKGLYLPPFILHTYQSLKENSGLFVVANTLFNPEDPCTHDTYETSPFREMQRKLAGKV